MRVIKSAVFLLLFALAAGLCLATLADAARLLPVGSGYALSDQELIQQNGIPFTTLAAAAGQNEELIVSGQTSTSARITSSVSAYEYDEVKLTLTDEYYLRFHDLSWVRGNLFSTAVPGRNADVAVISEKLATQVFASVDVIGSSIKINGVKLVIVGVYKEDSSILSQISTDGRCEVLVPYYTCVPSVPAQVQYLYIRNAPSSAQVAPVKAGAPSDEETEPEPVGVDAEQVSALPLSELDSQLGGKLALYESVDYTKQMKSMVQYRALLIFVIGVVFLFFLLCWWVASLTKTARWAVRVHKSVVPLSIAKLLRKLILPAVLVVVMIGIFLLIRFELFMPAQVIPAGDEILNFAAYFAEWIRSFQQYHLSVADGFFRHVALYGANAAGALIFISAVFEILLLVQAFRFIRQYTLQREEDREWE